MDARQLMFVSVENQTHTSTAFSLVGKENPPDIIEIETRKYMVMY